MKVSYRWLCEILPGLEKYSPRDVARKLTFAGLEVEEFHDQAQSLAGIVCGEVVVCEKHPQADRLHVCTVSAGSEKLQVVCGASNVKAGGKYPLATVGTTMPGGLKIAKAKLRGVESSGMLCSARELGLSENADGLLDLAADTVSGKPIAEILGLTDFIFTLNITPNRGDALGHWGVARDLAALTGLEFAVHGGENSGKIESVEKTDSQLGPIQLAIQDTSICLRYVGSLVEGVKVGASPKWLASRLTSLGIRSINNIVDATNYIMLMTGQPVHAFDADKIRGGKISVDALKQDCVFKALDGKEYQLKAGDPVICDGAGPVALAGVMGGEDSGVNEKTTRLVLETAYFFPEKVRRLARRLGLSTDSSYRFERAVNIMAAGEIAAVLADLVIKLAGGKIVARADLFAQKPAPKIVELKSSDIKSCLGVSVEPPEVKRILAQLGCVLETRAGGWAVTIPHARPDLARVIDLIEEIARIRGMDTIPEVMPVKRVSQASESAETKITTRVKEFFVSQGFRETIHYSFGDADFIRQVLRPQSEDSWLTLANPLSQDLAVMRPSLLPGLLETYVKNRRLVKDGLRFFELRSVYNKNPDGKISEKQVLAGLYAGQFVGRNRFGAARLDDFYTGRGILDALFSAMGLATRIDRFEVWPYHPHQAAEFKLDGKPLAKLGAIHPELCQELKISDKVFCFEIDFALLAEAGVKKTWQYQVLSPLPPVYRDLALVASSNLTHQEILDALWKGAPEMLKAIEIFDLYEGAPLPEGKKSLAYALRYESAGESLTDEKVNEVHFALVDRLTRKLGVQLR